MGLTHDGSERARRRFWNVTAKLCDFCNSAAALLFCAADSAFMCITCDDKVHNADGEMAAVRHGKVWMCEMCEQAPAAITCKADAASLCITCDRDIHSANPLAQRHDRVSVVPFYTAAESMLMKSNADSISDWKLNGYIPDSWSSTKLAPEMKSMELLIPNSDQFLDFDSVVPIKQPPSSAQLPENGSRSILRDLTSHPTKTPHLSHSVSSSSTDVGLVPDGSATVSESSYPFNVSSIANHGSQVAGMDRKARVLRYREKRKNRKFEKTIRYVSRKAYAETRPRIKGRFAKRTDSESEIDGILGFASGNRFADPRFGSFEGF